MARGCWGTLTPSVARTVTAKNCSKALYRWLGTIGEGLPDDKQAIERVARADDASLDRSSLARLESILEVAQQLLVLRRIDPPRRNGAPNAQARKLTPRRHTLAELWFAPGHRSGLTRTSVRPSSVF